MIDIVNVTKRFGKFTALSGMNLSVGCSSIYGLVGYNGDVYKRQHIADNGHLYLDLTDVS